jgi:hypothetical protein
LPEDDVRVDHRIERFAVGHCGVEVAGVVLGQRRFLAHRRIDLIEGHARLEVFDSHPGLGRPGDELEFAVLDAVGNDDWQAIQD